MELVDYLSSGKYTRFEFVRPLMKILVLRHARDGHERAYVGQVKQVRKPNAYVIDMVAEEFFEDSIKSSRFKKKEISFRNSSDISIYLLEAASVDLKQRLAEERKAYAKARKALQQARTVENESFALLGITESVTEEQFKKIKKAIMLKWHPDRFSSSNLSEKEFIETSKKYTDAISFVSNFISNRNKRLQ